MARHCTLIFLCALISVRDASDVAETQTRRLLHAFAAVPYAAGSRLAGMPYFEEAAANPGLPVFLNPLPMATSGTSVSQRRLLSLVHIFDGQWRNAEHILRRLAVEVPRHAAIQNDLGVVQMTLAGSDPTAWFKAIQQFKLASAADPDLPDPKFNLVLVYRRLRLLKLEEAAIEDYKKIEPASAWHGALSRDSTSFADKVSSLLDYVFHPVLPVPENHDRIAAELSDRYGDDTAKFALAAISTPQSEEVLRARRVVARGRELYFRGDLDGSRKAYAEARSYATRTDSVFDQLWVDVNDADAMTRMRDYEGAAELLRRVVETSRKYRLQWLLANALSAFGSAPPLSKRFLDIMSHLNEAVRIYRTIGGGRDSARSLYYLAAYNYIAHNLEESLKLALESLQVTDRQDHIRLSQLHWLISTVLYSMGYLESSIHFNEQAAEHADKVGNAALIASMSAHLASLYLVSGRTREAGERIDRSASAVQHMLPPGDRMPEWSTNLVRAQILLSAGDFLAAEHTLRQNTDFFSGKLAVSRTLAPPNSHVFLAKALAAQGRTQEAALEFRNAINMVEGDQDYLSNLNFQVPFDKQRRQVYESAIGFEYDRNNCGEAWNLTQGYKTKLFLDVLGKFDAASDRLRHVRLTRPQVEKRIPENTRLIDYAVLGDRILIWVLSRNGLQCRSTTINQYQLHKKVESFTEQLSEKGFPARVRELSEDLYDLLVEPIEALLDADQTVVIIPDGVLHRLPFSALRSRRDQQYWIEKMPMLQSPSISYFFSENTSPVSSRALAAFGSRTHDVLMNRELASLREIEPGIKVRTGALVTKEDFLRAIGQNFLLYYAGHSAFDVADPLRSLILLDGDKPGPNSVSALDIIERRMAKNGIVILAACDTSLGNFSDGPGIRGLTSAFLVAGAGSVIGSLWPVESPSTSRFMPLVFNSLTHENVSVAESLRSAQLQLIRSASDPHDWAGFIVTGNVSSVLSSPPLRGGVAARPLN